MSLMKAKANTILSRATFVEFASEVIFSPGKIAQCDLRP